MASCPLKQQHGPKAAIPNVEKGSKFRAAKMGNAMFTLPV